MDKETEDAFKLLTTKIQEGFNGVRKDMDAIKADMATKQDIKELENKLRIIVREEVQDIREAIEERCKPTQIG